MDFKELVNALRAGVDVNQSDPATQVLYERWLKRHHWIARAEAIPLLVGVDPGQWPEYLKGFGLEDTEQALWDACSIALSAFLDDSDRLEPARLRAWANSNGIVVPVCFERLQAFISKIVLGSPQPSDPIHPPQDAHTALAEMQEQERVLGAALSVVTKMRAECVDENGFFDGLRIARIIEQKAARWYGDARPGLSQSRMAALIDKWLE